LVHIEVVEIAVLVFLRRQVEFAADRADFLIAMFAVARAGAVIVPMDWRAKDAEKSRQATTFDVRSSTSRSG